MDKRKHNESGMVIVEATIVFPVMFLVIFLMLFAGNAYLQKCRVDSYVNQYAIDGAAYCADTLLSEIESGTIPSCASVDIKPYRYLFTGDINDKVDAMAVELEDKITNMSTGLFSGMKPTNVVTSMQFHNGVIYSTISVEASYQVAIPVRLMGESDFILMNLSSRVNMPVSDTTEFIRNINMVEDYMQKYGVTDKINEMMTKVKEWFKK